MHRNLTTMYFLNSFFSEFQVETTHVGQNSPLNAKPSSWRYDLIFTSIPSHFQQTWVIKLGNQAIIGQKQGVMIKKKMRWNVFHV